MYAVFKPDVPGGVVAASIQERQDRADRLRAFIERSGKTQRQIADELGVDESYVSKLASGAINWTASRKFFAPLVHALGVRPDEVAEINPSVVIKFTGPPVDEGKISHVNELERVESLFTMKPVYGIAEAGKPAAEMQELDGISPIPVRHSDLRPGTVLFQVSGQSMQIGEYGGILPDDIVFVDTGDTDAAPERVFVIAIVGGGVCIKRVRALGGSLWLFSDNPDQANYPPFQADDARIIGRVHNLTRWPDVRL